MNGRSDCLSRNPILAVVMQSLVCANERTGAGCRCDAFTARVRDVTPHKANSQASFDDFCIGLHPTLADRAHEADLHVDGRKVFTRKQRASERDSHGSIGKRRDHATVNPPHGIVVNLFALQTHDRFAVTTGLNLKADKL